MDYLRKSSKKISDGFIEKIVKKNNNNNQSWFEKLTRSFLKPHVQPNFL